MLLPTPAEFSFPLSLEYLRRSPQELLHELRGDAVVKALKATGEVVVFRVTAQKEGLSISFLTSAPGSPETLRQVSDYVREWFDLETDLKPFYAMAANDKLLRDLVTRYHGYRIVGQPDLFESLIWAVLGQQINLGFAYTLKERFVRTFGEKITLDHGEYFLFPSPHSVAVLRPEQLVPLQFSRQKSRYTIGIAEAFASGVVSKERLKTMPLAEAKRELMQIKGIGNWTANYALMKTFRHPDAFPLEDAGLHNAIRNLKKLKTKPTPAQVARIFIKYKGWEAYATLYLWKSLGKNDE
ncbi:MAG TPA: DNA-3-methyladenine glycosylase [Chryseosolibacter sp.]|nr:DNA-3-methyladenine glycosylase [Chryseosolibacter sp.]